MSVSLSNIINVSVSSIPTGLSSANINSLALFTTEVPNNADIYTIYKNSTNVGTDFGTNSTTYKMARAIFAQSPNLLTGSGRLVIIPMLNGTNSATSGNFLTANISANLDALKLVSNGDLKVILNGTTYNLTNIDFTKAETFEDIAIILNRKLNDTIITSEEEKKIRITSKKVGEDSTVTLGAVSGGTGTDLSGANYFNTTSGASSTPANSSGETLIEAIERIGSQVEYYGIITNLEMEDEVIENISDSIQAMDKIFLHHFSSTEDVVVTTGIISKIKDASNNKTRCLFYSVSKTEANLFKSAYAGRCFSVNFNAINTSATMQFKSLSTITSDDYVNDTLFSTLQTAGADYYANISGLGVVISNGSNDYFDNVYNKLWIKKGLEISLFNALYTTNNKLPQTEKGMSYLKGSISKFLSKGVLNGSIGTGLKWNSSDKFGDPEDFERNITDTGFYIYSIPIASQSQEERNQRIAPVIQVAIKFAGAIHSCDIIVNIES